MKKVPHPLRGCTAFLLGILILSLCGCSSESQDSLFLLTPEENPYTRVVKSILPEYEVEAQKDGIFWYLEAGAVTEAYELQAYSALKAGVAAYWYPQYLVTPVIAIDRDQTMVHISTWRDLKDSGEPVGFYESSHGISAALLLLAMSYGLEGDEYTLETASSLLEDLNNAGKFRINDFDVPIIICLDERAVQMIGEGRNLEIIVPAEGTFTYKKGLLSTVPLTFAGDVERALLDANLRLMDGRCDATMYPDAASYAVADEVADEDHFLITQLETERTLRRDVRHVRLYSGADGREHQIFALLYIAVIFIWAASVMRRAMQKSVRRGMLTACMILLAWITVRLVKYQTNALITWDRFLWFSFLGFQLLLMFTLLVMAWRVDHKPGRERMPKWLWALGALNLALALVVLTNDLHAGVYLIDYANPFWRNDYGYAVGYRIITVLYMAEFVIANMLLLMKSIRTPNRKMLIFPLALCVLIFVYRWGYISRIPLMWESDMTMVTGAFVLMFFESAIQAGMIPVNTKYTQFFLRSTLGIQILDRNGSVVLAAASARDLNQEGRDYLLSGAAQPLMQEEGTLLYGSAIAGGYALWQEDISALSRLHRETEESVCRLAAANALLAEEEKIKRSLDEEVEKLHLMERLEAEIAGKTQYLTQMIGALDAVEDQEHEAARIALLLCYIKRRCNLFFREQEAEHLPVDEFSIYIDEMVELGRYAKVNIAEFKQFTEDIPVRQATLFYDFFFETVAWAAECGCKTLLLRVDQEQEQITMRLMPSVDADDYFIDEKLQAAIGEAGGAIFRKELEDATGISLSFPVGGGVYA